ncbi:MAG: hypothetical protein U0T81_10480 [Saprospiraceae bacterium]
MDANFKQHPVFSVMLPFSLWRKGSEHEFAIIFNESLPNGCGEELLSPHSALN